MKGEIEKARQNFTKGNLQAAYNILFPLFKKDPDNPEILLHLGIFSGALGIHSAAKRYFERIKDAAQCFITGKNLKNVFSLYNQVPLLQERLYKYTRPKNLEELVILTQVALLCKGNVLEIGCGSGDLSIFTALNGATVFGIDSDPIAIEIARNKAAEYGLNNVFFDLGEEEKINLPDDSFDTVVLAELLENVNAPLAILTEARRLCKPGGRIIISVPNGYSIPDEEHIRIYNKEILREQVFRVLASEPQWIELSINKWILGYFKNNKKKNYPIRFNPDISKYFLPPHFTGNIDYTEKVSVIIPTYNRTEYLPSALESIFRQTYKNFEVIVVDDGSSEDTRRVLGPYLKKITYLQKENGGKASAVNLGLKYATGKYVWVFDDDDVALPRKLEIQVKKFQQDRSIGLIHTSAIYMDKELKKVLTVWNARELPQEEILKYKLSGCIFHGGTVIVRKECFDRVGPWDESLIRAQDYDIWIRIARKYNVKALSLPTILFRLHDGLRGYHKDRFLYTEIPKKTLKYEKIIFKKLYNNIPLEEIFPGAKSVLSQKVEAYIIRAYELARRGLYDECINDISQAYELAQGQGFLPFSFKAINIIKQLAKSILNIDESAAHKLVYFMRMIAQATK
ncbi:MAG: glycosyltransferase [Thermosipho sp. (in: Bacteria)]|nr:glycosyltransferase [Thermosipho sp. (in: thermotogales)]